MDAELSYLEDYLREEFSGCRGVRVRVISGCGTARSVDLVQDYDAESNTVHREAGVQVRTERSEWFFPREWIGESSRGQISRQIDEIRSELEER